MHAGTVGGERRAVISAPWLGDSARGHKELSGAEVLKLEKLLCLVAPVTLCLNASVYGPAGAWQGFCVSLSNRVFCCGVSSATEGLKCPVIALGSIYSDYYYDNTY